MADSPATPSPSPLSSPSVDAPSAASSPLVASAVQTTTTGDYADLSRRQMLSLAAGAVVAGPLLSTPLAAAAGKFFTAPEFALVDELSEMIIPEDAHSPGARAAKVAAYIDARLAEEPKQEVRKQWRDGLRLVDDLARKASGKTFMASTPAERLAVLTQIAANERKPESAAEKFFVEVKGRTAYAYYTSEIGIQKDIGYKGNTMLDEFVGTDVSKASE